MDFVMETIDEQIIKPILKRTASITSPNGFLGELLPLRSRPPTAPKKHVCINEASNDVGLTYSPWEYDRSKLQPSEATLRFIQMKNSLRQGYNQINQCQAPLVADGSEMDLVLTEQSFSSSQWDMIGSSANVSSEFRVGEWADMFLSMGHA